MLAENKTFEFGYIIVSEQEIIDFAKRYDPLDFHIDKEVAKKSIFKGLVTSGPHIFHLFYKNKWLPLFRDTVLCGLELNQWKLLKPIYAGMKIFGKVTIINVKANTEKQHAVVKWRFDFTNEHNEPFQTLEMTVLHKYICVM